MYFEAHIKTKNETKTYVLRMFISVKRLWLIFFLKVPSEMRVIYV